MSTDMVGEELRHQPRAPPKSTWKWGPWIAKLATLLLVKFAKQGLTSGIEAAFPWEIYVLVLVIACLAIGMWEFGRSRYTARLARLRLLRDQATADQGGRG